MILSRTTYCSPAIRLNQHGYLPADHKIAVIANTEALPELSFQIVDRDKIFFRGYLSQDKGIYLAHAHHYLADFSSLKKSGRYRLRIGATDSDEFEIGDNLYQSLPDSILRFFAVQRCGTTSALLHRQCHMKDASSIKGPAGSSKGIDLTGGWHDAGDYVKFTLTTAYSTYLLLLAYQQFPELFDHWISFGLPAPLEEAKIGLEWLMKAHPGKDRLISQVQSRLDHDIGWRLPESDPLTDTRVGWEFSSKAIAGSAAAALALGASVFSVRGDDQFASKCLEHASQIFALTRHYILPDRENRPDSNYYDREASDNIALAAIELYRVTKNLDYLEISKQLADSIGAGGWISWGDLQGLAAFRLAEYYPNSRESLRRALEEYQKNGDKNPYCYPFDFYPWGSSNLQSGVGILAAVYEIAGGGDSYRYLAARQRDALFGANPFGISYVSSVGDRFARNFHHQVAYIKRVILPGAISEGPISRKEFEAANIRLEYADQLISLQSESAVYHDDRMDYLTNEPTISGNAQAFFLLCWYAKGYNSR